MRKWYLGIRHNPQLKTPYYKVYGQLFKKQVKEKEQSLYGTMILSSCDTKEELITMVKSLQDQGRTVYGTELLNDC